MPVACWPALAKAYISFGQGIAITPLQLALAFGAIANGGRLLEPYLVRQSGSGAGAKAPPPGARGERGRPLSPRTLSVVANLLAGVTLEGGTGRAAVVPGHPVAGKTGRPRKAEPGKGYLANEFIASFAGYAPTAHPAIVAVVVLDDPRGSLPWWRCRGAGVRGNRATGAALIRTSRRSVIVRRAGPGSGAAARGGRRTAQGGPPCAAQAGNRDRDRRAQRRESGSPRSLSAGSLPDLAGMTARQAAATADFLHLYPILRGAGVVQRQEPPPGLAHAATGNPCRGQFLANGAGGMRLSVLVQELAVLETSGPTPRSRRSSRLARGRAGRAFVTWSGAKFDGRLFAGQAIERGAVAVLTDRPRPAEARQDIPADRGRPACPARGPRRTDLRPPRPRPDPVGNHRHELQVDRGRAPRRASSTRRGSLVAASARWVTTSAATTVARQSDGSNHVRVAPDLFRRRLRRGPGSARGGHGRSSHALVQGRVQGARFDIALFTNLTRDHLDFHGDLETYFAAKRRLFDALKPGGLGVANLDDTYGRRLADELGLVHTFGSSGSGAAVRTAGVDLDSDGIRGALVTPRGQVRFRSPLLGRFNLANLLAAAAAAEALGLPFDAVTRGIEATRPLAGRMEAVRAGQAFLAIVDFAHTDAALEAAIRALREPRAPRSWWSSAAAGRRIRASVR